MFKLWFILCMREWKRILGDVRILVLLLIGPFFYALVFGGVYWQGRTKSVPIVVVDQDHSELSREMTTALGASENLRIAMMADSATIFPAMNRQDNAYACVIFPPHFERDVLAGRQPRVGVLYDASNTLLASTTMSGIRSVLATYQSGISMKRWEASGVQANAGSAVAMPLVPVTRQLFNPTSNYSFFILMGLVCIAVQSVTRMSCGIALELDTPEKIREEFRGKKIGNGLLLTSKLAATASFTIPVAFAALSLPFVFFGAPFRGSLWIITAGLSAFSLAQIGIAYGYSAICRSTVISTQVHMFMSVVMFTLSGFTWPYYAAPRWIYYIAILTPLFHMNCLVRKTALVGAPLASLGWHLTAIFCWMLLSIGIGYWAVNRRMSRTAQRDA